MTQTQRGKRRGIARKQEAIQVRVSLEEKRAFSAKAASVGLAVSAWLRMIALEAIRKAEE